MIRVSVPMVKQASVRGSQQRAASHKARVGPRGSQAMQLLPAARIPQITRAASREPAELDAILAIVPESPTREHFAQLPESERWHELNARSKPRSGTVRTTVLANR